jgi:hypothetical protein
VNRTVTISAKGALVAVVAALALLVAYLLGTTGGTARAADSTATPATAQAQATKPRTMVTSGTGSSLGVPDELAFTVSVGLLRPTLTEAMAAADARMHGVLGRLDALGVRRSDIQTTGLSMNAVYDYHSSGPPTLRGYHVSQRAQVLVHQLAAGGRAVSAVIRAGGDDVRVSGLGLRISDPDSLLAKSRAAAVAQATVKAKQYAADTGQTLGSVLSLREVHATAPAPTPLALHGVYADDLPTLPIRAGRDKLAVTVRIVWSFR